MEPDLQSNGSVNRAKHGGLFANRPRRVLWRFVVGLGFLLVVGLGIRAITNASTFQLFGDYVARVVTSEKVVALTFDDGPHPQHTPQVLELLDQHQAKATFFMLGRNVERYPQLVRDVQQRGHEIGNHSYSHPVLVMKSPQRVRHEISRTDKLLRSLQVAGPLHFRPPHLSKLIVLPYVLGQMQKLSILADVDAEEWKRRPASTMSADVLRQARPGSIILMHDTAGVETLRTLESVIVKLKRQGYRFVTISQLLELRDTSLD